MALASFQRNSSQTTPNGDISIDAILQELVKLQDHCEALNDRLLSEKEKSTKLRRYLAHKAQTRQISAPEGELSQLQALIVDQSRLIEQLYAESQESAKTICDLEKCNNHLTVVNTKQKQRIIHLNRQLRQQNKVISIS